MRYQLLIKYKFEVFDISPDNNNNLILTIISIFKDLRYLFIGLNSKS